MLMKRCPLSGGWGQGNGLHAAPLAGVRSRDMSGEGKLLPLPGPGPVWGRARGDVQASCGALVPGSAESVLGCSGL